MTLGPGRRSLIILAKEPRPGRVKTRLARDVGPIEAAAWYRRHLQELVRRLGRDPRWQTTLCVSPDGSLRSRAWPVGPARTPQGRGDLGARMARALSQASPGPAILIGADILELDRAHIAGAFQLLGRQDAVLGPAEDGGYWLVGFRHGRMAASPGIFDNVRWSTPHALADTLVGLARLRVGLCDRLADADTLADLQRAQAERKRA